MKTVSFNIIPIIHVMYTWKYAYHQARKGDWEMYSRDRFRFNIRIQRAAIILNPILNPEHRLKIYARNLLE